MIAIDTKEKLDVFLDKIYENEIIKEIFRAKTIEKTFDNMIQGFDEKLKKINFIEKSIEVEKYFGNNMGKISTKKKLLENKIITDYWLDDNNDFKGLYMFLHNNKPFYFGISKGVISRINQHIKGTNHFHATLAFNMGLIYYKLLNKNDFIGKREDFDFKKYVDPMKLFLLKQKIAFVNIKNDDELYLFEIYCSIKYKTILNRFETH